MAEVHVNSKKVTIFRAGSFLSRAQGKDVEQHFADSKLSVGAYFEKDSQKVASGLDFEEEELLLPTIIDTPPTDKEFRKKVSEFYNDIDTKVPYETGRELEIGLKTDNTKAMGKGNIPLNVMDYLRYRHAKGHPYMGSTKEDADGNPLLLFYIFDKSDIQKVSSKKNKDKDEAMQIYLTIKEKPDMVPMLLTLLGTDIRTFHGTNKEQDMLEALRAFAEDKAELFNKTYTEGRIETRSTIQLLINTKIFEIMHTKVRDVESKFIIGNSMEEAIVFFEDEANGDAVIAYKARLQEAIKKPAEEKIRFTQPIRNK